MEKYILVGINGKIIHTERNLKGCSIQELSLMLLGIEEMRDDIMEIFKNDFNPDYKIVEDP